VDQDPEANLMIFRSLYGPLDAARVISDKIFETSMGVLIQNQVPSLGMLTMVNTQSPVPGVQQTLSNGRESFTMTKEILAEMLSGNMTAIGNS
jgi:hypothetical protein